MDVHVVAVKISENVTFRNDDEELERTVKDNQNGASVDDECQCFSTEYRNRSLNRLQQRRGKLQEGT